MINWTEVIISICSIVLTGILIPLLKAKIDESKQEKIIYWTEIAVRWAKQYMSSEEGEKKKEKVLEYLSSKLTELGIKLSLEDIDMIIEAVYEQVKSEVTV